jgi:hypothetical protein
VGVGVAATLADGAAVALAPVAATLGDGAAASLEDGRVGLSCPRRIHRRCIRPRW